MTNPSIKYKHPARDACLCIGGNQAPPAPHFIFLINPYILVGVQRHGVTLI